MVTAAVIGLIGPLQFFPTLATGWFYAIMTVLVIIAIINTFGSTVYYLVTVSRVDQINTDD